MTANFISRFSNMLPVSKMSFDIDALSKIPKGSAPKRSTTPDDGAALQIKTVSNFFQKKNCMIFLQTLLIGIRSFAFCIDCLTFSALEYVFDSSCRMNFGFFGVTSCSTFIPEIKSLKKTKVGINYINDVNQISHLNDPECLISDPKSFDNSSKTQVV